MIGYLDSSVILRVVLGEPGRLQDWAGLREGVTSALAEVECLRTIDRLVLRGASGKMGRGGAPSGGRPRAPGSTRL